MRDQHQRRALLGLQRKDQIDHTRAGRGIEVAGRLVGEQHARRTREGARDRDTLLLAAGELARVMPQYAARARRARGNRARAPPRARSPRISSGNITFSSRSQPGSSWNDWNTKPTMRARRRARRVLVEARDVLAVDADRCR
jgi:hypothetical protein